MVIAFSIEICTLQAQFPQVEYRLSKDGEENPAMTMRGHFGLLATPGPMQRHVL